VEARRAAPARHVMRLIVRLVQVDCVFDLQGCWVGDNDLAIDDSEVESIAENIAIMRLCAL